MEVEYDIPPHTMEESENQERKIIFRSKDNDVKNAGKVLFPKFDLTKSKNGYDK